MTPVEEFCKLLHVRYHDQPAYPIRVLILFSGTGSVGEALAPLLPEGSSIMNVDNDPQAPNAIHVDIRTWRYRQYDPGYFDVIWASPPCTQYSKAKTGPRDFESADALAEKTLEIINYFQPPEFFIENPVGLLATRPFMANLEHLRREVSYCQFGTPYQKNTHIWSAHPHDLPHCDVTPCKNKRLLGYHPTTAQGGPSRLSSGFLIPGTPTSITYRIPPDLVKNLLGPAVKRLGSVSELYQEIELMSIPDEPTNADQNSKSRQSSLFQLEQPKKKQQSLFRKQTTLLTFEAKIESSPAEPITIMFDSGSSNNIMSAFTVAKHNIATHKADKPLTVVLADGTRKAMHDQCAITYTCGSFHETRTFWVLDIHGFDIIWGMKFATEADVVAHFSLRQLRLRDANKKRHTLVANQAPKHNLLQNLNTISAKEAQEAENLMAVQVVHKDDYVLFGQDFARAKAENPAVDIRAFYLDSDYIAVLSPCQVMTPPDGGSTISSFIDSIKPGQTDELDLTSEHCTALKELLVKHKELGEEPTGLPPKRNVEHHIPQLPHTIPPCFNFYRMSPTELMELKKQLDFLLEHGYIRPSNSPYGAPVLFAPKKDGGLRLCLDFRGLNNQTPKDKYPLPRDQDIFDQLQGAKYFSTLDALWGYWQIRIAEADVHKTSVRTPLGSYEFLVMPFGLTNAPATFQKFMESALRPFLMKFCMVYIDDIIIYSKTAEEHMEHIRLVLEALDKEKIKIKLSKCNFFRTSLDFLGHVISRNGIKPQPKKIEAIQKWPQPTSVNEVQQFMGMVNYYRRHINNLANMSAPLTDITEDKGPFAPQWTSECTKGFQAIKDYMSVDMLLAIPNMALPFTVQTDASRVAIGGSLHQTIDGEDRPVAFESKKLQETQRNWPTHERELYAIYYCVKTWRHYLQGSPISLTSDHKPLLEIRKQKQLSDKQARWVSYLESFDYNITYKAGELLIGPDALSRRPDHFKLVLDYLGATVTISELAEAVETADRYDGHNIVGDLAITGNWIQTLTDSYKTDQLFLKTEKELAEKSKPRSPFYISNGLLFFKDRDKPSPARLYVPDNSTLRNSIISEVHDLPIAGHFSRDKTLQRLQRYFYWPNMEDTVTHFIKSCDKCSKHKYPTHKAATAADTYAVPDYPWDVMCMDEKTGLPETQRGNSAFWVFVDRLSRRAHAIPVAAHLDTFNVAKIWFTHIFPHHGFPHTIISDRDARFTSAFWENMWKLSGTKLNIASTGNAQADGGSERWIKTCVEILSNFAEENPTDWDLYLPSAEFAYNDSIHPETGFTPFEIDMGRSPNTPISILMQGFLHRPMLFRDDLVALDPSEYLARIAKTLQKTRELTRKGLERRKENMQRNTTAHEYKLGDFVYLKHPNYGTPSHTSLEPNFVGPFRIIELTAPGTYRLLLPESMRFRHPVVNERKIKPFHDRQDQSSVPSLEYTETDDRGNIAQRDKPVPSNQLPTPTTQAPAAAQVDDFQQARVNTTKEPGKHIAELLDTYGRWIPVSELVANRRWQQVNSFMQQNPVLPSCHDPALWTRVAKRFRHGRKFKVFQGIVTEVDDNDTNLPYRVCYADGDGEDISADEFDRIKTVAIAVLNAIRLQERVKRRLL
jgi:hypothetical protein